MAHNSFVKGTDCFSLDVSDFIMKFYFHFHKSDLRYEKFRAVQERLNLPLHFFIVHCCTRWLTLNPSSERTLEQLPGLEEYFLKQASKKYPKTLE